jgi:hypothetical protein
MENKLSEVPVSIFDTSIIGHKYEIMVKIKARDYNL